MSLYGMVQATLRLGLKAYFAEVDSVGAAADGPLLLLANHHNSMVDPFLVIAATSRPVSFIAKEPLFRKPLLGSILRGLHCIPAHRQQDAGYAKEKNEALYAAAAEALADGRAIGIFPEGKSHSDPRLAEFKRGASRIAFEAAVRGTPVRVQLVGIHFEVRRGFRGRALLQFGPPLALDPYLDRYAQDPRETTAALTADLQSRLAEMIIAAGSRELVQLADLVERMVAHEHDLKATFDHKKALLERHDRLRESAPRELDQLKRGLRRYRETLDLLGVRDDQVAYDYPVGRTIRFALRNTILLALSLPVLAVGLACNVLPYLVAWCVSRLSTLPDRRATGGFTTAIFAFPLAWAALAWLSWRSFAWPGAAVTLAIAPLSGLVALQWLDRWHVILRATWGLWLAIVRPAARARLRRMRGRLLRQLADLGARP